MVVPDSWNNMQPVIRQWKRRRGKYLKVTVPRSSFTNEEFLATHSITFITFVHVNVPYVLCLYRTLTMLTSKR